MHKALALIAGLAVAPPARSATLQVFQPAPGRGNFITTYGATVAAHRAWTAGAVFDYADNLLVGARGQKLLDSRFTVHAMGAITLWKRLDVGAVMPLAVLQRGAGDLDGASPGDARLVPKLRGFWIGDDRRGVGGAFVAEVTFPTGDEDRANGDPSLTFVPRIALEAVRWGWDGALNLGYRVRESSGAGKREVDDEAVIGAAVRTPPLAGFSATLDLYAFVGVAVDDGLSDVAIPCEALGAVRYVKLPWGLSAWLGGGAGVTRGYGGSAFRVLAAVGYESRPPRGRPAREAPTPAPVPVVPELE